MAPYLKRHFLFSDSREDIFKNVYGNISSSVSTVIRVITRHWLIGLNAERLNSNVLRIFLEALLNTLSVTVRQKTKIF